MQIDFDLCLRCSKMPLKSNSFEPKDIAYALEGMEGRSRWWKSK